MRSRNIIILVIILLVLCGIGYGVKKYFQQTDDVVSRKPDYILDVKSILAAFESDSTASNKKYMDKVVQVTGNVKRIDTSGAVVLGEQGNPSEVVVGIDRRHMDDIKHLEVGESTTMQGILTGYRKEGGDDLLSSLGATVELKGAAIKSK
jgi:hypothetical protein